MAATITNVLQLIALELFAFYVAALLVQYLLGFNVIAFLHTQQGRMILIGIGIAILASIYGVLNTPADITGIGASLLYDPKDKRRVQATTTMWQQPIIGS